MATSDNAAIQLFDTYALERNLKGDLHYVFSAVQALDIEPAAKATLLTKLLAASEHTSGMVATLIEANAALRASAKLAETFRAQRDEVLSKLDALENALEIQDEDDPRIDAIVRRIREEREVVPSDEVYDVVTQDLIDTLRAFARREGQVGVTKQHVAVFLDKLGHDELDEDVLTYVIQLIQHVNGVAVES